MSKMNPFLTNGYVSAEYFCDRTTETSAIAQQKPKHCCVILRMATTPHLSRPADWVRQA